MSETVIYQFKIGDVVTLKSGGCLMTVIHVGECTRHGEIDLSYSRPAEGKHRIVNHTFPAAALRWATQNEIDTALNGELPF